MRRYHITVGARTTAGGTVRTGHGLVEIDGKLLSVEGDQVHCPTCNSTGVVVCTWPRLDQTLMGKLPALENDICRCQCTPPPRLLPIQNISWQEISEPTHPGTAVSPARVSTVAAVTAPLAAGRPTPEPAEEEEEEEELTGITLRIGLFFDGTGDNAQNARIGAQCQASELGYSGENQRSILEHCQSFQRDPRSSYGRQATNIWRLFNLYRDELQQPVDHSTGEVSLRVYVPGVGTQINEPDVTFPDMALGTGERGVEAQISLAVQKGMKRIRQFGGNNPALQIDCVKVDLFGFSRGAAAARHFLNDLAQGTGSMLAQALPAGQAPLAPGFRWQAGDSLCIGVLGLFDTVAAIGSPGDGWDVHDARNSGLNLYLAPGCAERVIHLVATDERRHNFSLNSAEPGFHDIQLPGAHGDIGGNYPVRMDERLLLTPPYLSEVDKECSDEDTAAYRKATAALQHWRQYGLIDPQQPNGRLYIDCHSVRSTESPLRRKTVYAQVRLERQVQGEYGRIPLRIMHTLAVQAGAAFRAIDEADPDLTIPSALQAIADKLLATAEQGRAISLTPAEQELLWAHYIHQSDSWNVYPGMSGGLNVQFVDRPTEAGHRARYPNRKDSA